MITIYLYIREVNFTAKEKNNLDCQQFKKEYFKFIREEWNKEENENK
jgi:hypothetical protein